MPAKLRFVSGLTLLFFVFTHFINHGLGIFDLKTQENARLLFNAFWRNPAVSIVFLAAIVLHISFVLQKTFLRPSFAKLSRGEWMQLVSGFLIPPVLFFHFTLNWVLVRLYGVDVPYTLALQTFLPNLAMYIAIVTLVWVHGCYGLHFYLRLKPGYARYKSVLHALMWFLPLFALAGSVAGAREVALLAENNPGAIESLEAKSYPPGLDLMATMQNMALYFYPGYALFLLLFFSLRKLRIALKNRNKNIRIKYSDTLEVRIAAGTSILDASLGAGVPHANICGGRGRCSTCRIRVVEGQDGLDEPGESERKVLERVGAGPGVRLACQARPREDTRVLLLVPADASPKDGHSKGKLSQGVDREIAILFADLRGFTSLSEHRLPYDVVFLLNRYFHLMGEAIEQNGGHLDKFIGDGIMALFGIGSGPEQGCRDALAASGAMSRALGEINRSFAPELPSPLRMGIGIHCGHVIVGEMGYKHASNLTAIGDAVNTASRLESATKEHACELIVSDAVAGKSGADFSRIRATEISVRGRTQPMKIHTVEDAKIFLPPE